MQAVKPPRDGTTGGAQLIVSGVVGSPVGTAGNVMQAPPVPAQEFHVHHNRERITRALDSLTRGLVPYIEDAMKSFYYDRWMDAAQASFRESRGQSKPPSGAIRWDAHSLLTVMWDQWNRLFRHRLGQLERSIVSELRELRNRWAHQTEFNFDDTYRFLDSVERLLRAINAPEAADVAREKRDHFRQQYSLEARVAFKKAQVTRRKWKDLCIYAVCCAAIDFVIFDFFGVNGWFFALFTAFVFAYLAYQRLVTHLPIIFGPHECEGCGKIIYGETCPYCEKPPEGASTRDSIPLAADDVAEDSAPSHVPAAMNS